MSGETEEQVSGWTVDTLKAYLESRLEGIQREVKVAFDAAQLAVAKAENATEKRFESVNEFRSALTDQTSTFVPREVFDTTVQQWGEWRADVDADRNALRGRAQGVGMSADVLARLVTIAIAAGALLAAVYIATH